MLPAHMSSDKSVRGLVEQVSAALHLVPHKRLSLKAARDHRALSHHDDREVRLAGLRQVVDYMRTHGLEDKLIGQNYDQLSPGPSPSEAAVGLLPAHSLASTHRTRDEGSSQGSSGHTTASPALSDGSPPLKRPR